jgi:hypothetical protein
MRAAKAQYHYEKASKREHVQTEERDIRHNIWKFNEMTAKYANLGNFLLITASSLVVSKNI